MSSDKHSVIHLLSGGLDSVTLLYDLVGQGKTVHALMFDYCQQHVQELQFAKIHCHRLHVLYTRIELPPLGGLTEEDWVVPFRNPIMLALAANLAIRLGAGLVTLAINSDDNKDFKDCRWEVIDAMNHAIGLSGYDVAIEAPYLDWPKWKIAGLAQEMGVPLHEIWTCYKGGKKPCGKCPACRKLKQALKHDRSA